MKTNAMRALDNAGAVYRTVEYRVIEDYLSGDHVASLIGMPEEQVFKTLVTTGDRTGVCVFCIPVCCELDLKKAAAASGNRKIEMLPLRNLLATTGYVRGGCSPVGMKKKFPIWIDETAVLFEEISVSAGIRGCQVILAPQALIDLVTAELGDLTKDMKN